MQGWIEILKMTQLKTPRSNNILRYLKILENLKVRPNVSINAIEQIHQDLG